MEKSQYDELKAQQNIHWWFTGKREIVLDFAEFHAGLAPNESSNNLTALLITAIYTALMQNKMP